jgi:methylmalonyl-CoA/ethylmalonyl-CoA epimerase
MRATPCFLGRHGLRSAADSRRLFTEMCPSQLASKMRPRILDNERLTEIRVQVDHLGLVVKSLARGNRVLSQVLSICDWTAEIRDPVNGVLLQFGRDPAGVVYERLEPLDESSPVYNAIRSGKTILNNAAYRVENLRENEDAMRHAGCAPTSDPKPAIAYGGRKSQFFITPLRLIIELIEAPDHAHRYLSAPIALDKSGASS